MKYYIGLDAHSRTSTFVTLDSKGDEISRKEVPTTEQELRKYVQVLKGPKVLTVEESHVADWVYSILLPEVDHLLVCNPFKITKKVSAKNDYIDALHLARELRSNNLEPVYHDPDNSLLTLRILIKQYEGVARDLRRLKSRLKALFLSEANPKSGTRIFSDSKSVKELTSTTKQFIAEQLQLQISQQEEIKKTYISRFKEHHKKNKTIRDLDSIPGFSVTRSCQVAAIIGTPERFKDKHHLWSYAGLVRHIKSSGGVNYGSKKGIGRKQLQSIFIEAANNIATVSENNDLKKFYDQLRSQGYDHKKARRAVARKVATICWIIMKKGDVYRDSVKNNKKRTS